MKKTHNWTAKNDEALKRAIDECKPIFEHFSMQNKKYNDGNAWDAVAGRMLPDVCVTGAACRRRWDIIQDRESKNDAWQQTISAVEKYERELAETTFDGVAEILGNMDAIHDKLDKLLEIWK